MGGRGGGLRQEEANCKFSTNGGLIFYASIQPAIHLFELRCLFLFFIFFSSVFVSRTCLATCCTTGETCVSDIKYKIKT